MRPAVILLLSLWAGCGPSLWFDTPFRFQKEEWLQAGKDGRRNNECSGTLSLPLKLLWKTEANGNVANLGLLAGQNVLIVSTLAAGIQFLDVQSGEERASIPVKGYIGNTPVIADSLLIVPVTNNSASLACINTASGHELWSRNFTPVETPLLVNNGKVFATNIFGMLSCIHTSDSTTVWEKQMPSRVLAAPAADDSFLFVPTASGDIHALQLSDGVERWHFSTGAPIQSSPVVHDDVLLVGNRRGDVYRFECTNGKMKWQPALSSPVYASPTVAGRETVVTCSDGTVQCLSSNDGSVRWKYTGTTVCNISPIVCKQYVVVVFMNGKVAILEVQSGAVAWETDLASRIESQPLIINGIVFFATEDGQIFAFGDSK